MCGSNFCVTLEVRRMHPVLAATILRLWITIWIPRLHFFCTCVGELFWMCRITCHLHHELTWSVVRACYFLKGFKPCSSNSDLWFLVCNRMVPIKRAWLLEVMYNCEVPLSIPQSWCRILAKICFRTLQQVKENADLYQGQETWWRDSTSQCRLINYNAFLMIFLLF